MGNTSLDYSVNFWTEGVFSTALGVFGVAGIGIRIEDDAFSAVIASDPRLKRRFLLLINQYTLAIETVVKLAKKVQAKSQLQKSVGNVYMRFFNFYCKRIKDLLKLFRQFCNQREILLFYNMYIEILKKIQLKNKCVLDLNFTSNFGSLILLSSQKCPNVVP